MKKINSLVVLVDGDVFAVYKLTSGISVGDLDLSLLRIKIKETAKNSDDFKDVRIQTASVTEVDDIGEVDSDLLSMIL